MRRPLTFAPLTRDPERILVTALCPIGDTLLLTPALALLRGRYPAAHITVVLSPSNEGILLDNPSVDARLLVPERGEEAETTRFARGVRRLSEERPDLIINFSTLGTWVARAAALRAPTLGLAMPWLWGLLGTGVEGQMLRFTATVTLSISISRSSSRLRRPPATPRRARRAST